MKKLLQVTLMAIGAVIGFFTAAYGTYYGCMLMDKLEGKAAQDDFMAVGWIFWFVTIPLGVIAGIKLGKYAYSVIDSNNDRDPKAIK